jgi:hypothetical protein
MMYAYRQDPRELAAIEERAIADAVRGENHALLGWIVGLTLAVFPLTAAVISFMGAWISYRVGSSDGLGITVATGILFLLGAVAVAPITIALVRWGNTRIATRVRRFVREGTRHRGRIVQARRVSVTQSRIIVQGAGFAPCEILLSTGIPDAALFGQEVDVYVHPHVPGPPLVLVPESMPNPPVQF